MSWHAVEIGAWCSMWSTKPSTGTPPTARTQTRSWCARCGAGSRCQTTKHTPMSFSGISCIAHVHRSLPGHYPAHLQSNQREPDAVRQANRRHTHACAHMSDACNAAVLMQIRTLYIPKLRGSTRTGTYTAILAHGDPDPQLSPRGFSAPTSSGHLCTTPIPPMVVNSVPKTSNIHSYRHTQVPWGMPRHTRVPGIPSSPQWETARCAPEMGAVLAHHQGGLRWSTITQPDRDRSHECDRGHSDHNRACVGRARTHGSGHISRFSEMWGSQQHAQRGNQ